MDVQLYATGSIAQRPLLQKTIDVAAAALSPFANGLKYFNYVDPTTWASPNASAIYFGSHLSRLKVGGSSR